jgi:tetratricopeptide (TPR) repeat protein
MGGVVQDDADPMAAQSLLEESLALARAWGSKADIRWHLRMLGFAYYVRTDLDQAERILAEGVALSEELGDRRVAARERGWLGMIALQRGEYDRATEIFESCLAELRAVGDRANTARALIQLGGIHSALGDWDRAAALCEEAQPLSEESDEPDYVAWALQGQATAARGQGDYQRARRLAEQSLSILRNIGLHLFSGEVMTTLAEIDICEGKLADAQTRLRDSLRVNRGYYGCSVAVNLERLAVVAVRQGKDQRAAAMFGVAETLRERFGTPLPPSQRSQYERARASAEAAGPEEFRVAWERGRGMSEQEAVEFALAEEHAETARSHA